MGFSLLLYANAALQGAVHGMQSALSKLKQKGVLNERAVTSFAKTKRLRGAQFRECFVAVVLREATVSAAKENVCCVGTAVDPA